MECNVLKHFIEIIQGLRPIHGSRLSASPNGGCAEDTREDILQEIQTWVENTKTPSSVHWIRGKIGTGKTTIVRTIADRLAGQGLLGCAYFVSHDQLSTDPRNMIRTMAYDLANMFTGLRSIICAGIVSLGDIHSASLLKMMHALIVVPLKCHFRRHAGPVVIILDGVQHTFKINGPSMESILSALASALPQGTKLIITSVDDGATEFTTQSLPPTTLTTTLHLYRPHQVRTEVENFYLQQLCSIINSRPADRTAQWITDVVSCLAITTGHIFLFASVVTRYITAAMFDPYKRLEETVKAVQQPPQYTPSVFQPLDTIYRLILDDACIDGLNERHAEVHARLRSMLSYVVVAHEQLNVLDLAKLLQVEEALVIGDVDVLSSILVVVHGGLQSNVCLFHPSLGEFLVDPQRCTEYWSIPVFDTHSRLAGFCFDVMESTLAAVNWMGALATGADQTTRLQQSFQATPGLIYACTRWTFHVMSMGSLSTDILARLGRFCASLMLPWLEVTSAMDQVEVTCTGLKAMTASILVRRLCSFFMHDLTPSSSD
jgi:hypothetical protein